MKVCVTGGRNFDNYPLVSITLLAIHKKTPITLLINGGAMGADFQCNWWAISNQIKTKVFKADWKTHGRRAGPLRNTKMLTVGQPDLLVAFPGGPGTASCTKIAVGLGIPVKRVK